MRRGALSAEAYEAALGKAVLTTGEVARLLSVSNHTVRRFIAQSDLPHHKLPSGLLQFRVADLVRWAASFDMPLRPSLKPSQSLAVCVIDSPWLRANLPNQVRWAEVITTASLFQLGLLIGQRIPEIVILDLSVSRRQVLEAVGILRDRYSCHLGGICYNDEQKQEELEKKWFDTVIMYYSPGQVLGLMTHLINQHSCDPSMKWGPNGRKTRTPW